MEPVDARVTTEPSHLLACQTLRFLRNVHERVVQVTQPVQIVDDLLVTERFGCGDAQLGTDTFHFFDESAFEHLLGANIDTTVQFFTRQIETDLHGGDDVPVVRKACRIGSSRHFDDFQRTDGSSRIVRVHARRRFGILGFQLVEQRARTFGFLPFLKRHTYLRIGAGEGDVVDGGPCVQARASDEDRTHSPGL